MIQTTSKANDQKNVQAKKATKTTKRSASRTKKSIQSIEQHTECVSAKERHRLTQVAAFQRAQQRKFKGGSALQDWLEAELEINDKFPVEPSESSV